MTLTEYLKETSTARADFARQIGVSPETVRRYLSGERIPDQERMLKIAAITGCKVTADDFFGIARAA
jgi:transcriptional regulator with XRE-family HTH domain